MKKGSIKRLTHQLYLKKLPPFWKVPKENLKIESKLLLILFGNTVASYLFAFVLNFATNAVNSGQNLLAIILLILYLAELIVESLLSTFSEQFKLLYEQKEMDFASTQTIQVIARVREKVFYVEQGKKKRMETPAMMSTLVDYVIGYRKTHLKYISQLIDIPVFSLSIIGIMQVAMVQVENIILFIGSIILSIFIVAFISVRRLQHLDDYYFFKSKLQNKIEVERNDVVNISPINKSHIDFMTDNFLDSKQKAIQNDMKVVKKLGKDNVLQSFIIFIAIIVVIGNKIYTIDITHITPALFLSMVSFSTVYSKILITFSSQIRKLYELFNEKKRFEGYQENFDRIMDVYEKDSKLKEAAYVGQELIIPKFSYTYSSDDGKSYFTLHNISSKKIKRGTSVLLKGVSGVGKSTFMKIASGEILLSNHIHNKLKYVSYFNEATLGCKTLLREITFCHEIEEVDKERLLTILKGVQLYDHILQKSTGDVIAYLDTIYQQDLSTGLDQRALLARTLYHLEDVDLVCIDEPIGNLDEENAKKVFSFVQEYCNRDKKRFVLLSTHQYGMVKENIEESIEFFMLTPNESRV